MYFRSPMKFDKCKNQTKHNQNAKSAHFITSVQLKIYSMRPGFNLLSSQIEKMNKRIMMMTTNIPPLSFTSFIVPLDNSHRTNNVIKLSSPPFPSKPEKRKITNRYNPNQNELNFSAHLFRVFPTPSDQKPQNQ